MSALTPDETILGLLAANSRHGYELLACFTDPAQLGRVWRISASQIYNVLKRLEGKGWIVGHKLEVENAPPRTEYQITPAGYDRLLEWLHDPNPSASIRRIRVEFLSRLFIAQLLNIAADAIVQRQRAACQRQLSLLNAQLRETPAGLARLSLELHIAQLEAILACLERCETMMLFN